MSRTVAALYDSREEAEAARGRLISEVKAKAPRIIAKDTVAAVDGLSFSRNDLETYRDGLRRGGHLLVAEVPPGASSKRIIELLEGAAGDRAASATDDSVVEVREDFRTGKLRPAKGKQATERQPEAIAPDHPEPTTTAGERSPFAQVNDRLAPSSEPLDEAGTNVSRSAASEPRQELRLSEPQIARSGARVRAFTSEAPVQEDVLLHDTVVEVESRPSERRLSDGEIEAEGLFKERVFEIAEMREEPVVSKVAVVREEVIVRKTLRQRTETIRDTVRQTQVEVEDLPDEPAPAFFSDRPPAAGR